MRSREDGIWYLVLSRKSATVLLILKCIALQTKPNTKYQILIFKSEPDLRGELAASSAERA
jgi:hypothetical protein